MISALAGQARSHIFFATISRTADKSSNGHVSVSVVSPGVTVNEAKVSGGATPFPLYPHRCADPPSEVSWRQLLAALQQQRQEISSLGSSVIPEISPLGSERYGKEGKSSRMLRTLDCSPHTSVK